MEISCCCVPSHFREEEAAEAERVRGAEFTQKFKDPEFIRRNEMVKKRQDKEQAQKDKADEDARKARAPEVAKIL